jgi:predicted nucleic acid-binding protein
LILFCDTSALIKLYVAEDGSRGVAEQAAASQAIAVCRIAWVEAMSALSRRSREQPQDAPAIAVARQRFVADWPRYFVLEVTQQLVELAGDYADAFALRAYDSMQLAALNLMHQEVPGELRFACFDERLKKAARLLGVASI